MRLPKSIDLKLDEQTINRPLLSISAHSIQGRREHMEDFFDIGYQLKSCDHQSENSWPYEYFYFAVFDGHGGHQAAKFAKKNLIHHIVKSKDFWSNDDEDVQRAIRQGFIDCHDAMHEIMVDWPRTSHSLPNTAGTTASVLFIKNGKFYTGHVGDSRIVVAQENNETKQWISNQLTTDHKPETSEETKRIIEAGGQVCPKEGVHRVVWNRPLLRTQPHSPLLDFPIDLIQRYPVDEALITKYLSVPFLAIARSLGDFWSLNPCTGQYVVSPEPETACVPICSNNSSIILGTDGLWNVLHSTQATRMVQELVSIKEGHRDTKLDEYYLTDNFYDISGPNSHNHAKSLVYVAYQIWERRRLRADNITAVVVILDRVIADKFNDLARCPRGPYQTRASNKSPSTFDVFNLGPRIDPVQVASTHSFFENIILNKKPSFTVSKFRKTKEEWERIKDRLLLPPSLLKELPNIDGGMIGYPKNYDILMSAPYRTIDGEIPNRVFDIYIKNCSDDPADYKEEATIINSKGKETRSSSSQFTQAIHDFGQQWDSTTPYDQFESEPSDSDLSDFLIEEEDESDDISDFVNDEDEDDGKPPLLFPEEVDRINRSVILSEFEKNGLSIFENTDEDDDSDDSDMNLDTRDLVRRAEKFDIRPSSEDVIPQFRCLLNRTPLRRSERNKRVSQSEKPKKFTRTSPNQMKSPKRRRSQSIGRNLTHI